MELIIILLIAAAAAYWLFFRTQATPPAQVSTPVAPYKVDEPAPVAEAPVVIAEVVEAPKVETAPVKQPRKPRTPKVAVADVKPVVVKKITGTKKPAAAIKTPVKKPKAPKA